TLFVGSLSSRYSLIIQLSSCLSCHPSTHLTCLSAPIFSSFFFHCSLPHRHLHSFPTRRSSDLTTLKCSGPGANASDSPAPRPIRLEEHTSELQSRGHLVCRLLLEKKKKKSKDRQDDTEEPKENTQSTLAIRHD